MADPADLTETIETQSGLARSVMVDRQQLTRRGLQELIEADRYLSAKASGTRPTGILSFVTLVPPAGGG
jgi:hypothetical protein